MFIAGIIFHAYHTLNPPLKTKKARDNAGSVYIMHGI